MFYIRKTAPVALLTTAEAKTHLRVESSDHDAQIDGFIAAATAHLDGRDGILGRALVTQEWEAFAAHPCGGFRLDLGPVQQVTEVATRQADGTYVAIAGAAFQVQRTASGAIVTPAPGAVWSTPVDHPEAWRLTFTAGYGNPVAVPAPLKAAVLLLVGDLYENREAQTEKPLAANPIVARLVAPYRCVAV